MKTIDRRLKSLERRSPENDVVVGSIIRRFVSPSPSGPADSGRAFATILIGPNQGLRLDREERETLEAFEQRVADARDAA